MQIHEKCRSESGTLLDCRHPAESPPFTCLLQFTSPVQMGTVYLKIGGPKNSSTRLSAELNHFQDLNNRESSRGKSKGQERHKTGSDNNHRCQVHSKSKSDWKPEKELRQNVRISSEFAPDPMLRGIAHVSTSKER